MPLFCSFVNVQHSDLYWDVRAESLSSLTRKVVRCVVRAGKEHVTAVFCGNEHKRNSTWTVFLLCPPRGYIARPIGKKSVESVELWKQSQLSVSCRHGLGAGQSPAGNDVSTEEEDVVVIRCQAITSDDELRRLSACYCDLCELAIAL
jgi:hypothetical protein